MAQRMTQEQAEVALNDIVAALSVAENKEKLKTIVRECDAIEDQGMKMMQKMMKLQPAVSAMCSGIMEKNGFKAEEMMMGIGELQQHAMSNPKMSLKMQTIMQAFNGVFPDEDGEAEVCD